jgi:hypothetical protein
MHADHVFRSLDRFGSDLAFCRCSADFAFNCAHDVLLVARPSGARLFISGVDDG